MVIEPKVVEVPAHPLPFKGRLVEGDPSDVPPAVAMSFIEQFAGDVYLSRGIDP